MPDFVGLAKSFGLDGVLIDSRKSLYSALEKALNSSSPVVIDVRVRRGENCYPMVPPGKSNAQMVGLPSHPELAMELTRECCSCGAVTPNEHRYCTKCGESL